MYTVAPCHNVVDLIPTGLDFLSHIVFSNMFVLCNCLFLLPLEWVFLNLFLYLEKIILAKFPFLIQNEAYANDETFNLFNADGNF